MKLRLYSALGKNVVHRVVIAQEERSLVGLYSLPLADHARRHEHDLPGLLCNDSTIRIHCGPAAAG